MRNYAHLLGASSFRGLKRIVRDNMESLTDMEKRILSMRFSKLRAKEINSKLNISLQRVYYRERRAISKVLADLKSKQLQHMDKERILNMFLSEFAKYLPSSPNVNYYTRVRHSFSRIKDMKIGGLIEMGPSIMNKVGIGARSYDRLRKFLLNYDIKLEKIPSLYDTNIKKYINVLSTSSLDDTKITISRYGDFLEPLELKVLKMRLFGNSLRSIGMKVDLTRERIRKIESYALEKLRFYSDRSLENYTKDDVLSMKVSEFVNLIPPARDYKAVRIKNALLTCFSEHNLAYLVENPDELAKCPAFHAKCYMSFRNILRNYGISLANTDYFKPHKILLPNNKV